jgi:hypothetical protein
MTFLELQKRIQQTRKARKGIHNRTDYFEDDPNEEYYTAIYKRALSAANAVIRHYEELGEYDPNDKPKITWRD